MGFSKLNDAVLGDILEELFSKKITRSSKNIGDYEAELVLPEGRVIVEQIIRKHLLDNRDNEISSLRAKVFAYEKIISNSNFAPILDKEESKRCSDE